LIVEEAAWEEEQRAITRATAMRIAKNEVKRPGMGQG
jgi:hypothetical protein